MAQIGTVRLETQNSGAVDVPVFEPGDSASGIYEFVRVETASGPGFIPVTDPVDATYPYLRVQSQNNGIVAVTDTPGSAIPDSAVSHLNAKSLTGFSDGETVSTFTASKGPDGSAVSGPTYRSSAINGYASVEFDGLDDGFDIPVGQLSQVYTVFTVIDHRNDDADIQQVTGSQNTLGGEIFWDDTNNWSIFAGNSLDGSSTFNRNLLVGVFDGSSSEIREDGVSTTGNADSDSIDGASLGYLPGFGRYYDGFISLYELHDGLPSNGLETREQEIADMFDISLA